MGLLEKIMNPKFKDLIKTIMPDGQVWRFYYIQTPPEQTRPHFIPKGGVLVTSITTEKIQFIKMRE